MHTLGYMQDEAIKKSISHHLYSKIVFSEAILWALNGRTWFVVFRSTKNPGHVAGVSILLRYPLLDGVIHVELDRMRRHFEPVNFFHLQLDVSIDLIIIENAAGFQEVAV